MFVLLTLTIPRSFYLSEYELMTAVTSGNQTTGIDLFGSVTIYVQRRWNNPPSNDLRDVTICHDHAGFWLGLESPFPRCLTKDRNVV